jgi:hypothetical protein
MLSAGFKPAIPGHERPQTYALNRTATGIDIFYIYMWQNKRICVNTRTLQFSISVDAYHTAEFDPLSVNLLYLRHLFVVTVST